MNRRIAAGLMALCMAVLLLGGCASRSEKKDEPALPEPDATPRVSAQTSPGTAAADLIPTRLERDPQGVPVLKVYNVEKESIEALSVEDYLPAVLAGEMAGDWPLEALKAQAILARTFVMQFVTQKKSMYEGADISTDIKEAQAYDASGVNDRIRQAAVSYTHLRAHET